MNRGGNRRLNHALHMAAVTQLRYPGPGRDYYLRKLADGKTPKEALRCLKRRISDAIYRQLLADARRSRAGPGRAIGGDYEDQRGRPNPYRRLFDQATTRAPPKRYARRSTRVLTQRGASIARVADQLVATYEDDHDGTGKLTLNVCFGGFSGVSGAYFSSEELLAFAEALGSFPLPDAGLVVAGGFSGAGTTTRNWSRNSSGLPSST